MPKDLVVITGADTPTGLTTARALRDLPVEIWGISALPHAPCCSSRIWNRLVTVPQPANEQIDQLLDGFLPSALARKPILLLSQDDLVYAASRRRDELEPLFELPLPSAPATELMLDKTRFQTWALENGYAVPAAAIASNHEELLEAISQATPPYIIKPLVRTPAWDRNMGNQKCLWIRHDTDRSWEQVRLFDYCDRYLVQSWIEGTDADVFFCLYAMDRDGEVLDEVAGRKLTQWPKLTGSTAVCHTIDDAGLLDLGREILQKAGLAGLGSIEFKRDNRDGIFYITEPTVGRNDHQSAVAMAAGHNPTAALVADIFEYPDAGIRRRHGRSGLWIDELATFRFYRKEGKWLELIRLLVSNFRHGLPHPLLFRLSDMQPFGQLIGSRMRGKKP